jgi:hypothetical protein
MLQATSQVQVTIFAASMRYQAQMSSSAAELTGPVTVESLQASSLARLSRLVSLTQ